MSSTTQSPVSPSPFSLSSTSDSHCTSDDLPDLGAFTTVLREWIYLQPPPRIPPHPSTAPEASTSTSERRTTVWNHQPIAEYLESDDTDTEGRSVEIETVVDDESASSVLPPDSSQDDGEDIELEMDFQPSLGYLDEALSFIAAERARLDAQRGVGTSLDAWKHVIEPRRKRRRRKPAARRSSISGTSDVLYTALEDEGDDEQDEPSSLLISISTPMTPRPRLALTTSSDSTSPAKAKRKPSSPSSSRSKHRKKLLILPHSRSTPSLRTLVADVRPPPPDPDPHRLVTLARYLARICPAERALLAGVEKRLVAASRSKSRGKGERDEEDGEGANQEMELDPRGRAPGKGDPPVHVFIDHSNILFGLLTYLKRRTHKNGAAHTHAATTATATATTTTATTTATTTNNTTTVTPTTPIPLPSFATARTAHAHSFPTSTSTSSLSPSSPISNVSKSKPPASLSIPIPIPIPGSVALSTSAASDDILLVDGTKKVGVGVGASLGGGASGKERGEFEFERERGSEGSEREREREGAGGGWENEDEFGDGDRDGDEGGRLRLRFAGEDQPLPVRRVRHLSHTALALILERGRAVTRRVVVTSSPLYQPMDALERLGYEVRVYLRVPDLGDGMDRRDKHHRTPSWSPKKAQAQAQRTKVPGHARHISGSTSTDSAPHVDLGKERERDKERDKEKEVSGSGSGSTPPGGAQYIHPPQQQHTLHPSPGHAHASPGTTARIRYREQGVDELLQLKLHQALAATDEVPAPEGATIVLATGDGNVGQFSEDGFLGPVRTALKRGWRVELYAWEDGLSRAWRREFGDGSEWARNGMFQIIGMEQFAASLVEGGL